MVAASGHTNLPSRWSSNHVAPWEVLHEYPNCWVASPRPEFWPCSISEKIVQKDYSCFQRFVPKQTQCGTYTRGGQLLCRMGHSRTPEDKSGTLGSPSSWGKAASPRVSAASGELLEAGTWLLQKAAQDETSSVLLWRSEVPWWTGIFLPPWPSTWFSPFANYQMKHSNKSSSLHRQVPLQSQHPNSMKDSHVPELNCCMLAQGHILFSFLLFPTTFDVLTCSAVSSDDHLWGSY